MTLVSKKDGNQEQLAELQEKLLLESFHKVKRIARAVQCQYPTMHIRDDLEGYLFEQLTIYIKKFEPEKGDGKKFVNAVLRCKTRNFLEKAMNQLKHEVPVYLRTCDDNRRQESLLQRTPSEFEWKQPMFIEGTDIQEKAINKEAVKRLFEVADETERQIMVALMNGYSITETAQLLGFKHHEYVRRTLARMRKKLGYNPLA